MTLSRCGQHWLALILLTMVCLVCTPRWAQATQTAPATESPADSPRIGVVTMAPGDVFFERFGHDALVVAEPGQPPLSYNFGFFDPGEPDFIGNFARGKMMYWLVALPLAQDLQQYADAGRGATLQWLDLPAGQARTLADHLAQWAASPEARYRYDYYQANCATMVRDALDKAMDGSLHNQLAGRSRGNTWRSESVRLASPAPWMALGFDLALGPQADQPLSRWDEAFVPMRLADSLRTAVNRDGRPLVAEEITLLPHRLAPEPAEAPRRQWPWLLTGVCLAGLLYASARRHPGLYRVVRSGFWLTTGMLGVVMALLWGLTDHTAGWANRNLLLCTPVVLPLLALRAQNGPSPRWARVLALLPVIGSGIALLVYGLQVQPQYNPGWIALLAPAHAVLAWQLWQKD